MSGVSAELIEGKVYLASRVSYRDHGKPNAYIVTLLGLYESVTPGCESCTNGSVRLDLDNMPQPDALLRLSTECGGQSSISSDDYVEGAPELCVEISNTSSSIDLNEKLRSYRRNGVREYLVHRTHDRSVDFFRLIDGQFVRQTPDENGVVRSEIFPGLWIATQALIERDVRELLATLQRGLGSPEHAAFVAELGSRNQGKTKASDSA